MVVQQPVPTNVIIIYINLVVVYNYYTGNMSGEISNKLCTYIILTCAYYDLKKLQWDILHNLFLVFIFILDNLNYTIMIANKEILLKLIMD